MVERIRIGQANSLVKVGDPVPNKPGQYYELGQFSPSPQFLSAQKLQESKTAGLLPTTLPIYDDEGNISEQKIDEIDIGKLLAPYGIYKYNKQIPVFAAVGFVASLQELDKPFFNYINIEYLEWVADINSQEDQINSAKTLITGYGRMSKNFVFTIFQPFFNYLSTPLIPSIKGLSTGLSVSSYSVLKTLGYMAYDKMKIIDLQYFIDFLRKSGWDKYNHIPKDEKLYYYKAGEELGYNKDTSWYRDSRIPTASVASTMSPKETFAEAFAFSFFHRMYLESKTPKLAEFMNKFTTYINNNY